MNAFFAFYLWILAMLGVPHPYCASVGANDPGADSCPQALMAPPPEDSGPSDKSQVVSLISNGF